MKILIIKTSALGDIVQVFPAIQFLKQLYPDATIDWAVEESGRALLEAHPLVHKVIALNSKKWRKNLFSRQTWQEIKTFVKNLGYTRYDLLFDFQGNTKSGLITFFAQAENKVGFASATVAEKPNLLFTNKRYNPPAGQNIRLDYVSLIEQYTLKKAPPLLQTLLNLSEEEKTQIEALEKKLFSKNILLAPFSLWKNKQMVDSSWINFLKEKSCAKIWLIYGSEEEKIRAEAIVFSLSNAELLPKLTLPTLQHFMAKMDLVYAVDSLPLHLAGEASVLTFSIFGASSSYKYRPLTQNTSIQGPCPYGITFEKRCPRLRTCETGACIRTLNLPPSQ